MKNEEIMKVEFCEVGQRPGGVAVHNELQVKSPLYKGMFCEKKIRNS